MRNLLKLTLCLILLTACGGNKDKLKEAVLPDPDETLGSFNLLFPDNNLICTEGEDLNNDELSIEFLWSASENATSYQIDITNQETNEVISATSDTNSKAITLAKGSQYSWSITAILDANSKESTLWSFYSEGISQDNFAPFPATITAVDNGNGFVEISWKGADLDNDIKKYDLYFGTDAENLEFIVSSTDEDTISNAISYGTDYHIEVITTDDLGNTSTSKMKINYQE